jgi:hypothetical protein
MIKAIEMGKVFETPFMECIWYVQHFDIVRVLCEEDPTSRRP